MGKYQFNLASPSSNIFAMYILSEEYRLCRPFKLIPCMQRDKRMVDTLWSVLFVIPSAYEIHTQLFYVTDWTTFLALTRVPKEI